jgi:hypothetical protein
VRFFCESWGGAPEFFAEWPRRTDAASGLLLCRFVGTVAASVGDALGEETVGGGETDGPEEWPEMGGC